MSNNPSVHLRGIGHATKQDPLWFPRFTGITACAHLAKILWTARKLQALGSSYVSLHRIADGPKKLEFGLIFSTEHSKINVLIYQCQCCR